MQKKFAPRPLPKPKWLLYSYQVAEDLAQLPMTKHGRAHRELCERTYRIAVTQHHYAGTLTDWRYLIGYVPGVYR